MEMGAFTGRGWWLLLANSSPISSQDQSALANGVYLNISEGRGRKIELKKTERVPNT